MDRGYAVEAAARQGLDEAARAPPNRFTDVVCGRERRLLLLGLERVAGALPADIAPASPSAEPLESRPRNERTASKLLSCLRVVQGRLRVVRQQQRLLGLVYSACAEPPSSDEEDEEPRSRPGTADVLRDAALARDFWQPLRAGCLDKRELVRKAADGEDDDHRGQVFAGRVAVARGGALPPLRATVDRRRTLAGFASAGKKSKRGVRRKCLEPKAVPKGAVLTLEDAVGLAKEAGEWNGTPPASVSPEASCLPRSLSTGALPRPRLGGAPVGLSLPSSPSSVSAMTSSRSGGVLSLTEAESASGPLSPLRVFPGLAARKPMPTKVITFFDRDGRESVRCQTIGKATGLLEGPNKLLRPFEPQVAELVIEKKPPTPRPPEEHPRDRHAPPWVISPSASRLLSPTSVYRGMGPPRFAPVESDALGLRSTPQCVWLSSFNSTKAIPRAPRAVIQAVAAAAAAATGRSEEGEGGTDNVRLDLGRLGLSDTALQALSECLPCLGGLEFLNLAGNKFSGPAVGKFVLASLPAQGGTLRELDLSGNRSLGGPALDALSNLVHEGVLRMLEVLGLSGVDVPERCWEPLFLALHTSRLLSLGIAETRLGSGRSSAVFSALATFVGDSQVTHLDLSGNFLCREGCQALAHGLAQTMSLVSLDLSRSVSNSFASGGATAPPRCRAADEERPSESVEYAPLLVFCEGLYRNKTLRSLSLADCCLEYGIDFLLGQALSQHPALERLDVTSSPHGGAGLACLLRAAGAASSPLRRLDVAGLRRASAAATSRAPPAVVLRDDASGAYELDLRHPQHRAVARALLGRTVAGKKGADCITELQPPALGIEGLAKVVALDDQEATVAGRVSFKYTEPVADPDCGGHPLAKAAEFHLRGRTALGLGRSAPLVAALQRCATDEQRQIFLEATAEALALKAGHLALIVRAAPAVLGPLVLETLLPAVAHLRADTPLGVAGVRNKLLPHKRAEEARLRGATSKLLLLNLRNPTGRYSLELESPCDRAVARRLQTLAAFEAGVQARGKLVDVSQEGNFEPARNLRHEGYDLLSGQAEAAFSSSALPPSGRLQLDYASRMRPPAPGGGGRSAAGAVVAADDAVVQQLCATLAAAGRLPWRDTLEALRSVLDRFALPAAACRRLAEVVASLAPLRERPAAAAETLLACFGCCSESATFASAAVLHDPGLVDRSEAASLRERLGRCHVLDWRRFGDAATNTPDGAKFKLDLTKHDERQVARFLLALARKEAQPEEPRLVDCVWSSGDLPAAWQEDWAAEVPREGTLSGAYAFSEEAIDAAARKDLAEKWLGASP